MRGIGILLGILILLFVTACGNVQAIGTYTHLSPRQIAERVIAGQENIAQLNYLAPDGEFFWDYITNRYQINIEEIPVRDGIVFYAGGIIVDEIAILLLENESDAVAVRELLIAYASRRSVAFAGYAPVQAGILANAIVRIKGNHVALLITEDPQGAEQSFLSAFSTEPILRLFGNENYQDEISDIISVDKNKNYPENIPPKGNDNNEASTKTETPSLNIYTPGATPASEPLIPGVPPNYETPPLETSPDSEYRPPKMPLDSDTCYPDSSSDSGACCSDSSSNSGAYSLESIPTPKPSQTPGVEIPPTDECILTNEPHHCNEISTLPPPENIADTYDSTAILLAWRTGDTAALTPMNYRILTKAAAVIDEVTTESMGKFDMQLAVYNWIIMWSVYDVEFLSNAPTARPNPNNSNPYGLLFDHVANCWGFTYTFQLFMDMLGIESIVVHGYDWSGGRHAWNMVHIYGSWYIVDVTLDVTLNNPIGVDITHRPKNIIHRHLNVSSEFIWNVLGHDWDVWGVPKTD